MKLGWLAILPVAWAALAAGSRAAAVDYLSEVKPLLRERCYTCHGALKQKKELRLDTVAAMLNGSSDGPVIEPGNPKGSRIIQRVSTADLEERMPPEHEGQPFSETQVKLLSDWIAAGALAPANEKGEPDPKEHWAFRECIRPQIPVVQNSAWVRNPVDAFVAAGHEQHGLAPQAEAAPEILLRRLYLDLIGLPPSAEELAFVKRQASSDWYEGMVDRLLNDPRYGERWARHWMDIWRYSDWYGLGEELRNSQKHIWHWRDWIVQALNANSSYAEMVKLMLAADELYPDDPDKLRATGFLARNFYLFNRNQWLEETVEHVSKGFLGLTMNCAKCHDHKYDPIRQTDFYQMRAFFEPYQVRLDLVPGEADLARDGLPRVFDAQLDVPTYRFIRGQESQPDKSAVIAPGVPAFLAFKKLDVQAVRLSAEAREPERRAWVIEAHLAAARRKLESAQAPMEASRATLVTALRLEADLLETNRADFAKPAHEKVQQARANLDVAEAGLAYARADLISVESRAEAMRAVWTGSEVVAEKTAAAVKGERDGAVAKARLVLAEAEKRRVFDPKRDDKEVKQAREALEKATQTAQAKIAPDDKYTLLAGARWTPTRFLSSTADDPAPEFPPQSTGRRAALADWIIDRRNPLTARVAANHIWNRHFSAPLAPAIFDLGRKPAAPTHPELLDWLAAEFMESGWDMKHLHRLIVTSATYRLSSALAGGEANAAKDADNRYLWRRNSIRIEAEVVRDSMLSLANALDPVMGGPSVLPANEEGSNRRSIYFFHSNNERNLFLATFDGALVRECYRRDQSIVPQQALALSNSKLALDCADRIAARLSSSSNVDDTKFIRRAMLEILAIDPSVAEVAACRKALDDWQQPDSATAARAHLIWTLLNHNDFVTLR